MNGYENQNTLVISTDLIKGIWSLISGVIYKKSAIVVGNTPAKNKVVCFHKIFFLINKIPTKTEAIIGIEK